MAIWYGCIVRARCGGNRIAADMLDGNGDGDEMDMR